MSKSLGRDHAVDHDEAKPAKDIDRASDRLRADVYAISPEEKPVTLPTANNSDSANDHLPSVELTDASHRDGEPKNKNDSNDAAAPERSLSQPATIPIDKPIAWSGQGPSFHAEVENIRKSLKEPGTRSDVDWSKIFPSDKSVLFFGERHGSGVIKDELIANMEQLHVSHIGLEMLPTNLQPAIDQFLDPNSSAEQVNASRQRLYDHFKEYWNPGMEEKYMGVIDQAKKLGIRVVALESPSYYATEGSDEGAHTLGTRNKNWAEVIDRTLSESPGARMAVLAGENHGGYSPKNNRLNQVLAEKYHRDSVVVGFSSNDARSSRIRSMSDLVNSATSGTDMSHQRFLVRLNRETNRDVDYVIHLPD